jgi:hypothetical protein
VLISVGYFQFPFGPTAEFLFFLSIDVTLDPAMSFVYPLFYFCFVHGMIFMLFLLSVTTAVQVKLLVGLSSTTFLIDSDSLKSGSDYYAAILDFQQKGQKRKRGQRDLEGLTIRHENIEPDVFQHIFYYLENIVVNVGGEFPMLDVLVAADFLRLDAYFYECVVHELEILDYIELTKQLWVNNITNPEQIQLSLSSGFSTSYSLYLLYDISYSEYAEILLSLSDVAIDRRIKANIDLPRLILQEWHEVKSSSEIVDEHLCALALMSAEYFGENVLIEGVSDMTPEQFVRGFHILRKELMQSHASFFERLLYASKTFSFTKVDLHELLEANLSVEEIVIILSLYPGNSSQRNTVMEWVDENDSFDLVSL